MRHPLGADARLRVWRDLVGRSARPDGIGTKSPGWAPIAVLLVTYRLGFAPVNLAGADTNSAWHGATNQEYGADAIVIGCIGMARYRDELELAVQRGVPEPTEAAVAMALSLG